MSTVGKKLNYLTTETKCTFVGDLVVPCNDYINSVGEDE